MLVSGGACVVSSFSCVRVFASPMDCGHQAPLFMGLFRQEYWSGLLFPFAGDLPDPEVEPVSCALAG